VDKDTIRVLLETDLGGQAPLVACPSPSSEDDSDFAHAFNEISFANCPSSPLSTSEDEFSFSSSSCSDSDFTPPYSPSSPPQDTTTALFPPSVVCSLCFVPGEQKICSRCLRLCDDYGSLEFLVFNDHHQHYDLPRQYLQQQRRQPKFVELRREDLDVPSRSRIRTTESQRQILDSVYESNQPLNGELVARLLDTLVFPLSFSPSLSLYLHTSSLLTLPSGSLVEQVSPPEMVRQPPFRSQAAAQASQRSICQEKTLHHD